MEEKKQRAVQSRGFPVETSYKRIFLLKKKTNKKNGFDYIFHPNWLNFGQ